MILDKTIEERLSVIEEILMRLEDRLFGNGQPGEIGRLKQRVSHLESWFWRALGAVVVLVFLVERVSR